MCRVPALFMRGFEVSGRYRTVALQAVGVAVIAAVVFIAFLRPNEPESLSGIDAPGGTEQPIVNSTPPEADNKKRRYGSLQDGPRGNGEGQSQRSSQSFDSGSEDGSDESDESFGGDDDSPPVDQYDDLATRLMMRVGEPSVLKELGAAP